MVNGHSFLRVAAEIALAIIVFFCGFAELVWRNL